MRVIIQGYYGQLSGKWNVNFVIIKSKCDLKCNFLVKNLTRSEPEKTVQFFFYYEKP